MYDIPCILTRLLSYWLAPQNLLWLLSVAIKQRTLVVSCISCAPKQTKGNLFNASFYLCSICISTRCSHIWSFSLFCGNCMHIPLGPGSWTVGCLAQGRQPSYSAHLWASKHSYWSGCDTRWLDDQNTPWHCNHSQYAAHRCLY